jgi:hypothetical protein
LYGLDHRRAATLLTNRFDGGFSVSQLLVVGAGMVVDLGVSVGPVLVRISRIAIHQMDGLTRHDR